MQRAVVIILAIAISAVVINEFDQKQRLIENEIKQKQQIENQLREEKEKHQGEIKEKEEAIEKLQKDLLAKKERSKVKIASVGISGNGRAADLLKTDNICVVEMKKRFKESEWLLMTAIMIAESGARPDAKGGPNRNGTFDYGCAQINNTPRALDPATNLEMALYKRNSKTGWNHWTVYKKGTYKKYL